MVISWRRQWGGTDRIVWIIVRKLDALWKLDNGFYIPAGEIDGKYEQFERWLLSAERPAKVNMPHIDISDGVASFTDGRHRFAWCRDHGVKSLPVTVESRKQIDIVKRAVGSKSRRCLVPSAACPPLFR